MSTPSGPRPDLSPENADRLGRALALSQELQGPTADADADAKLSALKSLLKGCRDGIHTQRPSHGRTRLLAVNQARNYLHFLPDMQHPQARGRLQSVTRRLKRALRAA